MFFLKPKNHVSISLLFCLFFSICVCVCACFSSWLCVFGQMCRGVQGLLFFWARLFILSFFPFTSLSSSSSVCNTLFLPSPFLFSFFPRMIFGCGNFFYTYSTAFLGSILCYAYLCGGLSMDHALCKMTISPCIVFVGSLQIEMYKSKTGPQRKKKKQKKNWITVA